MARKKGQQTAHHDRRAASNVDALVFVDPKKGGLGKRLNRHLFGHYTPELYDDDILFSTRLFNATPHVL